MAIPKIQGAQRDFSFGEVDVTLKRADDHPARKAGLRQMANCRILNAGGVQNRSGRRALFPFTNGLLRIEKFTISAGNNYKIAFAPGTVQIINESGTVVATSTTQGNGAALPWHTATDIQQIVYAILGLSIYITFGNSMRPQVITWNGVSTWTIADFIEAIETNGQKRTPFYRLSPVGVTLQPSGTIGNITVTFSAAIAVAGMVGTRVRWAGRQILLGSLISSSQMNATVIETLPPSQVLTVTGSVGSFAIGDTVLGGSSGAEGIVISTPNSQAIDTNFTFASIGDAVTGASSGATGVVTSIITANRSFNVSLNTSTAFTNGETINGPGWSSTIIGVSGTTLLVQLIQNSGNTTRFFIASETVAGPSAVASTSAAPTPAAPQAIAVWDDEIINSYRGFPASVFVDQFRVGFCNFPSLPHAIAWSAINSSTDLYVGATPSSAIFELAPDKVQIYFVIPGPEGAEFVFCDRGVYYIPISATIPLVPGSVAFNLLSSDGVAQVQPRRSQEVILYANAGANAMMAVIATGAYFRPFNTRVLSKYHQHLFNGITAIAVPTADGQFTERYVYVLNAANALVVGKYSLSDITSEEPKVGWGPWNGGGTVNWVGAWTNEVHFTSSYFGEGICERLDDTLYLDCALFVNAPPTPLVPPGGKGPLWFIPSQSVTLMDQGTRFMGTYQIDANGFIIPQNNDGENLTASTLVAGQPWTGTIEPFVADANPGNSMHQRMFKRRVSRMAVYVVNSTGFLFARLFSGPITPTSPALGTIMNTRRVPAWNQGDVPTAPPPLREIAERWRPLGRAFDPRVAIIKDTPGPLTISEIGIEASI